MTTAATIEARPVRVAAPANWDERMAGVEGEIARIRATLADLWARIGGDGSAMHDDPAGKPAAPGERASNDDRLSAIERELKRIRRQLEAIRGRILADDVAPMPEWDDGTEGPPR